jgi:2-iminobutanoate/2-iminopropanoate deaminase
MKNVGDLLVSANSGFHNVVKCVVYLVDMADFARVNMEYAKFFKDTYPARVCIAVHQLPKAGKYSINIISSF